VEYILPILFLLVAFIYSSIGLGGGSSYTAIMTIVGVNYTMIPITSLTLNLVVTFIGMVNFWKNGFGRLNLVAPFFITSIPFAYIAGSIELPEFMFQIILLSTLILIAVRIYIFNDLTISFQLSNAQKWMLSIILGATLGFIAGAVGIGGGIYLVPLIIMFGLGSAKEAAAAGALFIWINSLVGFIARYRPGVISSDFIFPLICAVLIGGFAGSYFGSVKFENKMVQKIMGIIIIAAIIFLIKEMI